jgi:SAM-dependent methyltransferase
MDEALKTKNRRGHDFYTKYLTGKIIDIGAGNDLVTPYAESFDMVDGDANYILNYRTAESYDSVHSSHCLEHMHDPKSALSQWWGLVRNGGYMVIVVPDEDLYEQGIWPSFFNNDHKNTFTLKEDKSWSKVSYNLRSLVADLPGAEVLICEIHDDDYDYKLIHRGSFNKSVKIIYIIGFLKKIIYRIPFFNKLIILYLENFMFKYFDYPIDQTMRKSLAQIQVVVKKNVF